MYNFQVSDMNCSHCVATIMKAVKAVDSEASVKIDLANIAVEIESAKPGARFAEAIEEAGYTPLLRP